MTKFRSQSPDVWADEIRNGNRRALAQAITLIESGREDDRRTSETLLNYISSANDGSAIRIGLSGTPGVGKSTFIEAFGMMLLEAGHKVAVLAIDPSSARSGGSILGDKTRMDRLSRQRSAFIRPSPSHSELGGVARHTRETIQLVEAAGFDIVLVETVGVGQSETLVAEMTDLFLLLIAPAGGDELQGVKRGIMEIADIIVINKADGALKPVAEATRSDYAGALRLLRKRPGDAEGFPCALTASAQTGAGLAEIRERIAQLDNWRRETGWHERKRGDQARGWLRRTLERNLLRALYDDPAVLESLERLETQVLQGSLAPEAAAEQALACFLGQKPEQ